MNNHVRLAIYSIKQGTYQELHGKGPGGNGANPAGEPRVRLLLDDGRRRRTVRVGQHVGEP